jgi:hypothetical protein
MLRYDGHCRDGRAENGNVQQAPAVVRLLGTGRGATVA